MRKSEMAKRENIPLEMAPVMVDISADGQARYGSGELSPNIIRRLEDVTGISVTAPGFPPEILDDEPEEVGYEVQVAGRVP